MWLPTFCCCTPKSGSRPLHPPCPCHWLLPEPGPGSRGAVMARTRWTVCQESPAGKRGRVRGRPPMTLTWVASWGWERLMYINFQVHRYPEHCKIWQEAILSFFVGGPISQDTWVQRKMLINWPPGEPDPPGVTPHFSPWDCRVTAYCFTVSTAKKSCQVTSSLQWITASCMPYSSKSRWFYFRFGFRKLSVHHRKQGKSWAESFSSKWRKK